MSSRPFRPFMASLVVLGLLTALSPAAFAADPLDNVTEVFKRSIPNVPGKSMIVVRVGYAPGEKTPAHTHEKSAFIMAYVLEGAIRSQVEGGGPARVYRAGETWFENPGAHHVVSENASDTEPASLLAVFVVDSDHEPLTTVGD